MSLGFADAIFRRERSDDRKCVCGSQANKLMAVSSKFGWVVSGPTKGDSGIAHFTTSNLIVQKPHDFMESQNQATELANSLNRFWDY